MLYEQQLSAAVAGIDGLKAWSRLVKTPCLTRGVVNPAFLFALHEALINAFEFALSLRPSRRCASVTLRLDRDQLSAKFRTGDRGCRQTGAKSARTMQSLLGRTRSRDSVHAVFVQGDRFNHRPDGTTYNDFESGDRKK